jgi:hypothetical protein
MSNFIKIKHFKIRLQQYSNGFAQRFTIRVASFLLNLSDFSLIDRPSSATQLLKTPASKPAHFVEISVFYDVCRSPIARRLSVRWPAKVRDFLSRSSGTTANICAAAGTTN